MDDLHGKWARVGYCTLFSSSLGLITPTGNLKLLVLFVELYKKRKKALPSVSDTSYNFGACAKETPAFPWSDTRSPLLPGTVGASLLCVVAPSLPGHNFGEFLYCEQKSLAS